MARTFVGVFQQHDEASEAIRALRQLGVPQESFKLFSHGGRDGEKLDDLVKHMTQTNLPEAEIQSYVAGIRQGSTVLAVTTDELTAQTAYDTLKMQGLVDINERATEARIVERERGATEEERYYTPTETVGPSAVEKWRESNKVITAAGTAGGAVQGAIIGTAIGGPVGTAIGAVAGAVLGAGAGATADAAVEAIKQEDAVRHEAAADQASGAPPVHDRPEGPNNTSA